MDAAGKSCLSLPPPSHLLPEPAAFALAQSAVWLCVLRSAVAVAAPQAAATLLSHLSLGPPHGAKLIFGPRRKSRFLYVTF